jgi:DNA-binding transcriptional regulator YiaG
MAKDKQIKRTRERLGESQTVFAARFGVDQGTISRWETRGIPETGAARLAVARLLSEINDTSHAK